MTSSRGVAGGERRPLRELFAPTTPRLGILSIGGALADRGDEVAAVLEASGQTSLRRFARLQPRVGEEALRIEDVHEFVTLYGSEYALVSVRGGWLAPEDALGLVNAVMAQGGRVLWEAISGDPVEAIALTGAEIVSAD